MNFWHELCRYKYLKPKQMLRGRIIENGKYVVFNNGSVWIRNWHNSGKPRKAKQYKDKNGYLCFMFNGKIMLTHRLIAKCFLSNPDNLPQVNHKNEIKDDNRVENLEWCDRKYNVNYGTRNERVSILNINHPNMSKPICQYTLDGKFVAEYPSLSEVKRQLGYNISNISTCCNGERKSAYGYVWQYKE